MDKMRVIVVGGFLGAGKTTLLAQAAKHFVEQGKRVGRIACRLLHTSGTAGGAI